jgi:hypothetical protein
MSLDLLIKLEGLEAGDVFNVLCPNGASWLFLTLSTSSGRIVARNITSQKLHIFCKESGRLENATDHESECVIASVAPLPVDVHQVLLGLDRRYRIGQKPECFKLTKEEIEAFLFLDKHHKDNPL